MKNVFLLVFLLLNCNILCAQTFEADLSLAVTSDTFSNGISAGESGLFNLSVTNLGPDAYPEGSEFGFSYSFRGEDAFIIDEFFDNDPVSSGCEFNFSNASPRPPEDGFFFPPHTFELTTALEVGQTATCQIFLSFEEPGFLETRWRMRTGTDPQTDNNEAFFTFRGMPQPVPLNIGIFIVLGLLLVTWFNFNSVKSSGKLVQ